MKLIEVTWEDAFMSLKVYTKENVSNRRGLSLLKTTGYLVHEDKNRIAISMQQNVDKDNEVRALIWIPICLIKSRREIPAEDKK